MKFTSKGTHTSQNQFRGRLLVRQAVPVQEKEHVLLVEVLCFLFPCLTLSSLHMVTKVCLLVTDAKETEKDQVTPPCSLLK